MFKPLSRPTETVNVKINEQTVIVASDMSVAAVLLQHCAPIWRSNSVSGEKRGPFCMIGNCFDCLVTIDGKPNQQACQTRVTTDMRIQTTEGST